MKRFVKNILVFILSGFFFQSCAIWWDYPVAPPPPRPIPLPVMRPPKPYRLGMRRDEMMRDQVRPTRKPDMPAARRGQERRRK